MATAASDDLTKRATSGQLTDAERASAWRVFLGAATDLNYKKLKDDALPDAASISSDSDPLSGLLDDAKNNDGWARSTPTSKTARRSAPTRKVSGGRVSRGPLQGPTAPDADVGRVDGLGGHNKLGYRQGMHDSSRLMRALEQEKREASTTLRRAELMRMGPSTRRTRMCYLTR